METFLQKYGYIIKCFFSISLSCKTTFYTFWLTNLFLKIKENIKKENVFIR